MNDIVRKTKKEDDIVYTTDKIAKTLSGETKCWIPLISLKVKSYYILVFGNEVDTSLQYSRAISTYPG